MRTSQSSPFRGDPRPPWKRTVWTKSPTGLGVEINAPRQKPSPALYGRQCETAAAKELRARGYTVTRSHLSRGGADLVAVGPDDVIQVQVKSTWAFTTTFLSAGIREIATVPATARREVWGFVRGRGHVLTVALAADGAIAVSGQEPFRSAVEAATKRMRMGPCRR